MLIGNVVDDTYTGVIDVKVTLTFYAAERGPGRPAAPDTPDRVLPLTTPAVTTPATPNGSSPRCTPPAPAAAARSTGT